MLSIFLSLFSYATVVGFTVYIITLGFGSHKYRDVFETAKSSSRTRSEFGVGSPKFQVPSSGAQPLEKRALLTISEGNDYRVNVQSHGHAWTLDEPTTDGGTDSGPDPVTAFLGALLSCMTISFKAAARRRQVTVERMEGKVHANSLGHVKNITMSLEVWSPDPEEKVRALLDTAKRGCYVSGVLKPEIEFKVELAVTSS